MVQENEDISIVQKYECSTPKACRCESIHFTSSQKKTIIIERRLKLEAVIGEKKQFSFMPQQGTMDAITELRQIM